MLEANSSVLLKNFSRDRVRGIIKKIDPQKDSKSNDISTKTWKKITNYLLTFSARCLTCLGRKKFYEILKCADVVPI